MNVIKLIDYLIRIVKVVAMPKKYDMGDTSIATNCEQMDGLTDRQTDGHSGTETVYSWLRNFK